MTDSDEIRSLLQRYAETFDARDGDAFGDLFTEDAVVVLGDRELVGRERLSKLVRSTPPGGEHRPGAATIELHGQTASARQAYAGTSFTGEEMSGLYEDELRLTPTGWKFARRVITFA